MSVTDIPEPVPKSVVVTVKPWYASKTMWAAILIALAGAGDALTGSTVLDSATADWVIVGISVVKMVLRKLTSQPIGLS